MSLPASEYGVFREKRCSINLPEKGNSHPVNMQPADIACQLNQLSHARRESSLYFSLVHAEGGFYMTLFFSILFIFAQVAFICTRAEMHRQL